MSSDVTIVLPDGTEQALGPEATGADLAERLGGRAAKDALIAVADGTQLDLNQPLPDRSNVTLVFPSSDEGLEVLRHSTAHVLAQAVLNLYPGVTCVGTFTSAHVEPEALHELVRVTRLGGIVCCTVREEYWQDTHFPEVLNQIVESGRTDRKSVV